MALAASDEHFRNNRMEESLAVLRGIELGAKEPGSEEVLLRRCRGLGSLGGEQVAAAIEAGNAAIEVNVKSCPSWMWLGAAHGAQAKLESGLAPKFTAADQSRKCFERATELDARDARAWFALAQWHYNAAEQAQGLVMSFMLSTFVGKNPPSSTMEAAEEHALRALSVDPKLWRAYEVIAMAQEKQKKLDEALEAWTRLIAGAEEAGFEDTAKLTHWKKQHALATRRAGKKTAGSSG